MDNIRESGVSFEDEKQMKDKIFSACKYFGNFEDPFPVWRSVKIDKLSDIERDNLLGTFWTFDKKSLTHWGFGNTTLRASCPLSAVDWTETISRFVIDHADEVDFNGEYSENEIVLEFPGQLYDVDVEKTTLVVLYCTKI